MRYENGEYMCLVWDGSPDAYYIMGHVQHKEGLETLFGEGVIDDNTQIGQARHLYGRWSMEPGEDGGQHYLREYTESGRGRFKITVFGAGSFAFKNNT